MSSADNLCKQFASRSGPTNSDGIIKRNVWKSWFWKKKSADDKKACKITQKAKS